MDGCFGCQVRCRHRYVIKERPCAGTYALEPEYTGQGCLRGRGGLPRKAVDHVEVPKLQSGKMREAAESYSELMRRHGDN
ncbi:MAG: hypothetical protein HY895_23040 [Deltaproteobacteria bacterium]|nr:hypothetical protein [Deltaproteobacteria bacterium]